MTECRVFRIKADDIHAACDCGWRGPSRVADFIADRDVGHRCTLKGCRRAPAG